MRYKATPLTARVAPHPQPRGAPPSTSTSFRLLLVILLLPVILIPLTVVNASGSLSLSPSRAVAGATIHVSGESLPPTTRGDVLLDGSAAGMPRFRVDHAGRMTTSFVVPKATPLGAHTITLALTNKKPIVAAALPSAVLTVLGATPTPASSATPMVTASPTASRPPTPVPTPTRTPTPTAALTPGPISSSTPKPTMTPSRTATATPAPRDPVVAAAGDIACDPTANSGAPARCDQGATAKLVLD